MAILSSNTSWWVCITCWHCYFHCCFILCFSFSFSVYFICNGARSNICIKMSFPADRLIASSAALSNVNWQVLKGGDAARNGVLNTNVSKLVAFVITTTLRGWKSKMVHLLSIRLIRVKLRFKLQERKCAEVVFNTARILQWRSQREFRMCLRV